MPIFAYQSFNANSSSTHNVQSLNSQHHTVLAHDHFASISDAPRILAYPTIRDGSPDIPVHGPADLLAAAPEGAMAKGEHTDQDFLSMLHEKARQIHQGIYRQFGESPDVLTFGEVDGTHAQLASMAQHAGEFLAVSSTAKKACQNFSIHLKGVTNAAHLGAGEGWTAIRYLDFVVVFVHVPNAIAKSRDGVVMFYQKIKNAVIDAGAGVIDIVMGDTNQSSAAVTPECVSLATGMKFADAHPNSNIQPMDAYNTEMGGTNAKGTEKYDVAVYNTESVQVAGCAYWSQQVTVGNRYRRAGAMTDHMGIAIKVERKGFAK